jgi:hypothetical protein
VIRFPFQQRVSGQLKQRTANAAMRTVAVLATLFVLGASQADAQDSLLQFTFANNSANERATAEQLTRLLREHPVDQWIRTRRIHIAERVTPHSHPILTLNTQYLRDDDGLLATFLHEQFHWLEDGNPQFAGAMRAYALAYPDAPARGPEGAFNLESTYRHLLVCDLEYQAMSLLVGVPRARAVLAARRFYTWIYDRTLNDANVRRIASEHGFILRQAAAPAAMKP